MCHLLLQKVLPYFAVEVHVFHLPHPNVLDALDRATSPLLRLNCDGNQLECSWSAGQHACVHSSEMAILFSTLLSILYDSVIRLNVFICVFGGQQ